MTGAFLLAAAFNVGSLPRVEHLDCEVSTNVVLATSPKMSEMGFTLSLFSTPSNVVEVAFGTDADLNGDISRKWCVFQKFEYKTITRPVLYYRKMIFTTAFYKMRWLVGALVVLLNLHSFVSKANEWNAFYDIERPHRRFTGIPPVFEVVFYSQF